MFDVDDIWNYKVNEMKVKKRKIKDFYDKFKQY
jgi:hypothetical protein